MNASAALPPSIATSLPYPAAEPVLPCLHYEPLAGALYSPPVARDDSEYSPLAKPCSSSSSALVGSRSTAGPSSPLRRCRFYSIVNVVHTSKRGSRSLTVGPSPQKTGGLGREPNSLGLDRSNSVPTSRSVVQVRRPRKESLLFFFTSLHSYEDFTMRFTSFALLPFLLPFAACATDSSAVNLQVKVRSTPSPSFSSANSAVPGC